MSDIEQDQAELPAIDVPRLFRTIIQDLQARPENYKRFGIYWWPIKALLCRAGYGPDQLYMLGTYQDPTTAAMVPAMDLAATLRAAMDEYRQNACYPHPDGRVENPNGELVELLDSDASL
jgi:hypothetical protein